MTRPTLLSYIVLILVLVGTASCATIASVPSTPSVSIPTFSGSSPTSKPTPFPLATPTYSQDGWKTYSNQEYNFSISYPDYLEITQYENPGSPRMNVSIGELIYIWSGDFNPLDYRGDCSPVETTEAVTIAGIESTKVTGYIGAMEATPQRYLKYIMRQGSRYYSFTLYALGFSSKKECCAIVWPLQEEDIALFEQINATVKFTD